MPTGVARARRGCCQRVDVEVLYLHLNFLWQTTLILKPGTMLSKQLSPGAAKARPCEVMVQELRPRVVCQAGCSERVRWCDVTSLDSSFFFFWSKGLSYHHIEIQRTVLRVSTQTARLG